MPVKELEFINLRLEVVKNFLDKNLKVISAEKTIIYEQEESDKLHDYSDDFSNSLFPLIMQEEIVIRTVFYELSAIIEFIFKDFAKGSFHKSQTNYSKFIGDKKECDIEEIKFITKLKFNELESIIEKNYNFEFNYLNGYSYEKIRQIRQIANNFKHCNGCKYPNKYNKYTLSEIGLSHESKPTREETYQAIDETKDFFKVLQKKIKPERKIKILESELENLE